MNTIFIFICCSIVSLWYSISYEISARKNCKNKPLNTLNIFRVLLHGNTIAILTITLEEICKTILS